MWSLQKCAAALVHDAVHCKGAQDNVSVLIVAFKHPAQPLRPRAEE
jgi:serine/threonine protein phosphatase PrpC